MQVCLVGAVRGLVFAGVHLTSMYGDLPWSLFHGLIAGVSLIGACLKAALETSGVLQGPLVAAKALANTVLWLL